MLFIALNGLCKYLNSVILVGSIPCNCNLLPSSIAFVHKYSVLLQLSFVCLPSNATPQLSSFVSASFFLIKNNIWVQYQPLIQFNLHVKSFCYPYCACHCCHGILYMSYIMLIYFYATPAFLKQYHNSSHLSFPSP